MVSAQEIWSQQSCWLWKNKVFPHWRLPSRHSWGCTGHQAVSFGHWSMSCLPICAQRYNRKPCIDMKPILTESYRHLYHSNDCVILHFGSYRDFSASCGCGNASWSPKLHPPGEYNHCVWWNHSGHFFFSASDHCSTSYMCTSSLDFQSDTCRKIR